jgi:hypothetical protein
MARKKKSQRGRFELRFGKSERDRLIADWIDEQQDRGFDVSRQVKDILFEVITGTSSLTGQPLSTGEARPAAPADLDDPIVGKLAAFED